MKHMMAGGEDLGAAPPSDKTAANGATNATTNAPARLPAEEVSLSLSDYVSQVAAEEGLIFLPKYLGHRLLWFKIVDLDRIDFGDEGLDVVSFNSLVQCCVTFP